MELTIKYVDYAPEELYEQVPIRVKLIREIPGPNRPDYWLGKVDIPIKCINNNIEINITHIVIAARWVGTRIEPGVKDLPVGISYVTDLSLLEDSKLDFKKCCYVAIGLSFDSIHTNMPRTKNILIGKIAKIFERGK